MSGVFISLGCRLPGISCSPPEGWRNGPLRCGGAAIPSAWPCSRWGLPSQPVTRLLVRSYRTVSPLPRPAQRQGCRCVAFGGLLSVALSRSSRMVGVTHHRVLWSPDFPLNVAIQRTPAPLPTLEIIPERMGKWRRVSVRRIFRAVVAAEEFIGRGQV